MNPILGSSIIGGAKGRSKQDSISDTALTAYYADGLLAAWSYTSMLTGMLR